jgi:hypothetical protein
MYQKLHPLQNKKKWHCTGAIDGDSNIFTAIMSLCLGKRCMLSNLHGASIGLM